MITRDRLSQRRCRRSRRASRHARKLLNTVMAFTLDCNNRSIAALGLSVHADTLGLKAADVLRVRAGNCTQGIVVFGCSVLRTSVRTLAGSVLSWARLTPAHPGAAQQREPPT